MVLLHKVHLVSVRTVYDMEWLLCVFVFLSILVIKVRTCLSESTRLSMCVARENFGEGVTHFELSVRNTTHIRLRFI